MRVVVDKAFPNALLLRWTGESEETLPYVYVDHVLRENAVHGQHIWIDNIVPGEAYSLHLHHWGQPAIYLTRTSLQIPEYGVAAEQNKEKEMQREIHTLRKVIARQATYEQRQRQKMDRLYARIRELEHRTKEKHESTYRLRADTIALEAAAQEAHDALRLQQQRLAHVEHRHAQDAQMDAEKIQKQEQASDMAASDVRRLQKERDALHAEIRQQHARLPWRDWATHRRAGSYPGPISPPIRAWPVPSPPPTPYDTAESLPAFQFPVGSRE